TIQTTPNPIGTTDSQLNGVSCTSATACTAAGFHNASSGGSKTLAERWNGTKWTIQTTPNPTGSAYSRLDGVSCASSTACTAVGYYYGSSAGKTLVERWNGTTWTIQTTPNPTGATGSYLSGVSCTSATACTAAGHYDPSGGGIKTLAERSAS
ncbi:MAG: hypothetical protein ABIR57_13410, partial [Aeromicrobium sp.]